MNLFESIKLNAAKEKKSFVKLTEASVQEDTSKTLNTITTFSDLKHYVDDLKTDGHYEYWCDVIEKYKHKYEKNSVNTPSTEKDYVKAAIDAMFDRANPDYTVETESDYFTMLGLNESTVLTEKVNQANKEINEIIGKVLRSKTEARKYEDTLNQLGIKVDFSPREGVNLTGPNGRTLFADRQNVIGPAKPGHHATHDDWYFNNKKRYKSNIKGANADLKRAEQKLADLKALSHDDIIRKYPDKTTEEALAAHQEEIDSLENPERFGSIPRKKQHLNYTNNEMHKLRTNRSRGHNIELHNDDVTMPKDIANQKVDYKGYLDSKDNDANKDFKYTGSRKPTPGETKRNELSRLKHNVDDSIYYAGHARDIINNKKKDDKYIEEKRKELEDSYKQALERDIENLKREKADADKDYNKAKEKYEDNNKQLADFRKQMGLKARKAEAFDSYLEKRANRPY